MTWIWTITCLVVAIVAATLGFASLTAAAASVGKVMFVAFIIPFLVGLLVDVFDDRAD